jgi:hypothetical protein
MGLLALAFAVVSAAIMTWGYHELDNTVMDAYVQEQKVFPVLFLHTWDLINQALCSRGDDFSI